MNVFLWILFKRSFYKWSLAGISFKMKWFVDQNATYKTTHPFHRGQSGPLSGFRIKHLRCAQDIFIIAKSTGHKNLSLVGNNGATKSRIIHRSNLFPSVINWNYKCIQLTTYNHFLLWFKLSQTFTRWHWKQTKKSNLHGEYRSTLFKGQPHDPAFGESIPPMA